MAEIFQGIKNSRKEQRECTPDHSLSEQERAKKAYPNHHPTTTLANYRAGREVWDTNGDMW